MADSIKDQLRKTGLVAPEPSKPEVNHKKWREELPDDETRLPVFDAPALIKPAETPSPFKRKK